MKCFKKQGLSGIWTSLIWVDGLILGSSQFFAIARPGAFKSGQKCLPHFDLLLGLRDIVFPVLWFSEGIDSIDDEETINLLKTAIFLPDKIRNAL